jgi:glycine/D-amino acid oxidase-like deaminating enzyme
MAAYDPRYDPLVAPNPGQGTDYAPTYWVASAGAPPADDGPISGDVDADVVIVGSGFTGLATALFLAREHGIRPRCWKPTAAPGAAPAATAARARTPAGACTARSGSSAGARRRHSSSTPRSARLRDLQEPGGRIPRMRTAGRRPPVHRAPREEDGLPAQRSRGDAQRLRLRHAHPVGRRGAPTATSTTPRASARCTSPTASACTRSSSPSATCARPRAGREGAPGEPGAGRRHQGRRAPRAHARRHGARTRGGLCHRRLHEQRAAPQPGLEDHADPVELAGHAAPDGGRTRGHELPTTEVITDTRTLRFYYRRLPDNRVQIGSRSAITGADAPNPRHMACWSTGCTASSRRSRASTSSIRGGAGST